jgi:hypothetical protein
MSIHGSDNIEALRYALHPAAGTRRGSPPRSLLIAATAVVALVASLPAGCRCDPSDLACGTESLQSSIIVQTRTYGQDLDPDGYVIQVDDTQKAAGIQDRVTFEQLAIETTHTVSISDIARNCLFDPLPGDTNPRFIYLVDHVETR